MIDETDSKIIGMLTENSRMHFLDIAKKLKVSESTIRNRVGKLEKSGVIRKYSAIVEPAKLGFGCVAIIGIDAIPEKFLQVAKVLSDSENVKSVATSTGDHMIMIEVWMENAASLRKFISENIEKLEAVTSTCHAILMAMLKEN